MGILLQGGTVMKRVLKIFTNWKKVIDPMEKEVQTTSINSVKTGDNFAIQGYVLGLIGVMVAIVMMQKKYNK